MGRPEDIRFPVVCHYKIIAEDVPGLQKVVEGIFAEVNIVVSLKRSGRSDRGKYVTYSADVTMHSLELMRHVDRSIRAVKGVKLVL